MATATPTANRSELQHDLNDADFRTVCRVVYEHCGIHLTDAKRELVRSRLAKRIRETGKAGYRDYISWVVSNPTNDEFTRFIDSLSTNLTSFFRENDHFNFLTRSFLPSIIARKQAQGQTTLRAWSAGCSSGEEAYTIAITLLEALRTLAGGTRGWDVKILASDISTRVLAKASAGVYELERVKTVDTRLRGLYFSPRQLPGGGKAVAVNPSVRDLVKFRHLNLMEHWPFTGPFDFIFCRNVMIYFDKPTQERLVNRYWDVLAPGGLLLTGHSESLTGIKHKFDYVQATIYRK